MNDITKGMVDFLIPLFFLFEQQLKWKNKLLNTYCLNTHKHSNLNSVVYQMLTAQPTKPVMYRDHKHGLRGAASHNCAQMHAYAK